MGERRVSYRVLVGKTEGKEQFRIPRRRGEHNIKTRLQERVRTGFISLRIGTVDRL
jgi:hypothetical protein